MFRRIWLNAVTSVVNLLFMQNLSLSSLFSCCLLQAQDPQVLEQLSKNITRMGLTNFTLNYLRVSTVCLCVCLTIYVILHLLLFSSLACDAHHGIIPLETQ